MMLIPAKCPDCGGDLKIPEGSASVICEYCGSNIIVTDVLGTTAVMQNCMTLAYSAMDSGNYRDAYDHFNRAIEIDLKNPNAWFGKAVCLGMTGKIAEDMFGNMIKLFESAFNYAPAEKVPALKKNAAAEIVKVMRHSEKLVQLDVDLIELAEGEEFEEEVKQQVAKVKDTVTKTAQKALQYDADNKDAAALMNEITTGKFFNPKQGNHTGVTLND